jgi:hypothetical protein
MNRKQQISVFAMSGLEVALNLIQNSNNKTK